MDRRLQHQNSLVAEQKRDDATRQREKRERDLLAGQPGPRDVADAIGTATAWSARQKGLMRLETDPYSGKPQARISMNVILDAALEHLVSRCFDEKLALEAIRSYLFHRKTDRIEHQKIRRKLGHPTPREERERFRAGLAPVEPKPRKTKPATKPVVSATKPWSKAPPKLGANGCDLPGTEYLVFDTEE